MYIMKAVIIQELLDYMQDTKKARNSMIKIKKNGKRYILPEDREYFVESNFIVLLLEKAINILNSGHSTQELVEGLRATDWKKYSYSSRAYKREKDLIFYMAIDKKNPKINDLLWEQGEWLEKAAFTITEYIEGGNSYVK